MKTKTPYFTLILFAALHASASFAQTQPQVAAPPTTPTGALVVNKGSDKAVTPKQQVEADKVVVKQKSADDLAYEKAQAETLAAKAKADQERADKAAADKIANDPATIAAKQAAALAAANAPRTEVPVSEADLKAAGINVSFVQNQLQLTGVLPGACAQRLSVPDYLKEDAKEDDKDADISSKDDLADHSQKIGLRVSFSASDDTRGLANCINDHKSDIDKIELATKPELGKSVIDANTLAVGGFAFGTKVTLFKDAPQSDSYKEILAALDPSKKKKEKHCVNCNIKELEKFEALNLKTLLDSDLMAEIEQESALIEKAKSSSDLAKVRDDLVKYAEFVNTLGGNEDEDKDKDKYRDLISKKFDEIITHSVELAYGDSKRQASRWADFLSKTYEVKAQLPGSTVKESEDANKLKEAFASGGSQRVEFLSAIDPTNTEVKAVLNGGQNSLARLYREVNTQCAYINSESALARCNTAKMNFSNTYGELKSLAARYVEAQRMSVAYANQNQLSSLQGQATGFNAFNSGINGFNANQGFNAGQGFNTGLPTNVFGANAGATYSPMFNQNNGLQYQAVQNGSFNNLYQVNNGSLLNANLRLGFGQQATAVAIPMNTNYGYITN